jgi:hypothetical protein
VLSVATSADRFDALNPREMAIRRSREGSTMKAVAGRQLLRSSRNAGWTCGGAGTGVR